MNSPSWANANGTMNFEPDRLRRPGDLGVVLRLHMLVPGHPGLHDRSRKLRRARGGRVDDLAAMVVTLMVLDPGAFLVGFG